MPSAGRALNPPVRVLCIITSSPKMVSLASFTASVDALAGTQSFELALITSDTDWRSCGALLAGTVLAGTHSTSNAVEVEVVGSCLVPGLQLHCVHEYQMET